MCNHPKCPKEYCAVQYGYDEYIRMSKILNLTGSKFQFWAGGGLWMPEETVLKFAGVEVILNPDGTYVLNDTTG